MSCILCRNATTSMQTINIFDSNGQSLNIQDVISKHFWFTVDESSVDHKEICVDCWQQTLSFSQFYDRVRDAHLKDFVDNSIWASQPFESQCSSKRAGSVARDSIDQPLQSKAPYRNKKLKPHPIKHKPSASTACKVASATTVKLESCDNDSMGEKDVIFCDTNDDNIADDGSDTETNRSENRDDAEVDKKLADYFRMNCDICSEKLESMVDIQQHFKNRHNINRGYLICNDCGKRKYKMRKPIIDHLTWHCDPNAFKCSMCEKTFGEETRLSFHKLMHHADDEKLIYKCNLCEKRFGKNSVLSEHMQRVHPPDGQIFKCTICPKEYKTKKLLHNHVQTVHNPKDTKHVCYICARVMSSKHTLAEHIKTHSDVRELFECDECGTKVKCQSTLIKHKKMHTDVQQTCGICFKVKPTELALKSHMRNVHGEANYKCTYCDKAFRRLIPLKEHIATHTGEVLYTCSFCTTTFKSSSNKFKHYKQVHYEQWMASKEPKN